MAKTEDFMPATKIHDRIQKLIELLGNGLYEKDTAIRLGLLTALAGESMFMLGAPGCAKSMIARRIKEAFDAEGNEKIKYFETLLNQFTSPEEVFGNISLKALNGELEDENGNKKEEYRRITDGMLPEADVAFLDEIWKASPAILNTLLTIVNERKFHNGSKVMNVPLKALFAASNELPAKNKGLEALYDRFIFRLPVDFIQNEEDFFEMISQPNKDNFTISDDDKKLLITNKELKQWAEEIDKINLSEVSKNVISAIRKEILVQNEKMTDEDIKNGELFDVGDRRWKKIAHILKASAFLNDRSEVDLMDCSLIENCIWGTKKQQQLAKTIVEKCLKENGISCDSAIEDIEEQIKDFENKIDDEWFELKKGPKTDKIVSVDNQDCYECIRDGTNEIWYVSVNKGKNSASSIYHDVYDSNKIMRANAYSFSKDKDKIKCYLNFTVNKNPGKTYKIFKKFSDVAQYTLQNKFTKENYTHIEQAIENEIANLKEQKERDAIPFKANLFADQSYNASISSKIDDSIKALEDAKVQLDKQKNRYYNFELEPELQIGDVILNDGSIFSSEEIKNLSAEQKSNVIGVVCIADESDYVIGVNQYSRTWDKVRDCCSEYGKTLPEEYSKNWLVPKIKLLSKIYENMDIINKSLKAVDAQVLEPREYWSYSETDDKSGAKYFLFAEEGGHDDHTTKDHDYAVCVIRKW